MKPIYVSTASNRDLGVFALFFGLFGAAPLHYLGYRLMAWEQYWNVTDALALAAFFAVIGLLFMFASRKRFEVSKEEIKVSDGFLKRGIVYKWNTTPKIKIRSFQLEQDGRTSDQWTVELLDGSKSYSLDRREGSQMSSRTLAEKLAKSIGCSVIEEVDSKAVEIPREELDMPFVERVQKYPELLGREFERPPNSGIEFEKTDGKLRFSWDFKDTGMWWEVTFVTVCLLLGSLVPLPIGKEGEGFSILDIARLEGHFYYFYVVGALCGLAFFVLFGYRLEIWAKPEQIAVQGKLWGVPIRKLTLPVNELEGISVRLTGRGALLHLISDARILDERLSDPEDARWVAYKVRHYYAELGRRGD